MDKFTIIYYLIGLTIAVNDVYAIAKEMDWKATELNKKIKGIGVLFLYAFAITNIWPGIVIIAMVRRR